MKVDISEFLGMLSSSFGVSVNEVRKFLNSFQRSHDIGLTTIRDEIESVFSHAVWSVDGDALLDDIMECWNRCLTLNTDMIKMLDGIKHEEGLEIALLSNIGFEHAKLVHESLSYDECGFFFSHKHFSCEVGARKPTKLFYQSFLMQHPEFQGCWYVDDLQENLDAADEFGFRVTKFSLHDENVKRRIYDLGELIRGRNLSFYDF
jgi:FMN phosphatase YigB (HAD superfamily)